MLIQNVKKQKDQFDNETNVLHVVTQDNIICYVPIDENNTDYQAIQEWVAEGNTIEDAD
jgi:hypothetical protein